MASLLKLPSANISHSLQVLVVKLENKMIMSATCINTLWLFLLNVTLFSTPIIGKPTCRCMAGFTGPNCERRVCDNYCLNGGTCDVSSGNQPVCRCLAEYTGDRCLYRKYCKRLLVLYKAEMVSNYNSVQ